MNLTLLGYIADAFILGTYALLSARGKVRPFHWANALGGIPLVIAEVQAQLWQVLILTGTFTVLGWVGLWTTRRRRPKPSDGINGICNGCGPPYDQW